MEQKNSQINALYLKIFHKIKRRISPEQNPVWFPLEHCTQGVKVDLFLIQSLGSYRN